MTDGSPGAAIEIRELTKRFGARRALDRIDLSVAAGEALALFGPNGAGKTTLLRILALGARPSAGSFRIGDLDPQRHEREIRRLIGVISHQSFLYEDLSARQNLEFFARLYGVEQPRRRADELLDEVALASRAEDPVGSFSRGMLQRLSFARALVHGPSVLLLDEPFTGLDPHAAGLLRRTLERLRRERRTVLLVTHNLTQGLELCDRWVLLSRGRAVDHGLSAETDRAGFESYYFERVRRAGAA